MKRNALICFGLISLVSLAGCATAPGPWVSNASMVTDHERIAAIERAAVITGVRVIWIHLPQKIAAPAGS